jgi:hypothetical protein
MAAALAHSGWRAPGEAGQGAAPPPYAPEPARAAPPPQYVPPAYARQPYAPLPNAPPPVAPPVPVAMHDPLAPWAHRAAFPIGADGMPAHPMSRREWKEWRRNYRDQMKFGIDGRPMRTIGERIIHFRRHVVSNAAVIGMLFGINMLTNSRFPWFLFPAIFMTVGLVKEWGGLWSEGVTLRQLLARPSAPDLASLGSVGAGAPARGLPAPSSASVQEDEAA